MQPMAVTGATGPLYGNRGSPGKDPVEGHWQASPLASDRDGGCQRSVQGMSLGLAALLAEQWHTAGVLRLRRVDGLGGGHII